MSVPIPIPRTVSKSTLHSARSHFSVDDIADLSGHQQGGGSTRNSLSRRSLQHADDAHDDAPRMRASSSRVSLVGIDDEGHEVYWTSSLPPFLQCAGSLLPHGSIASSGFNLASATLGAGVLALPQAMGRSGVLLGSIMLLLCFAATVFSVRLLVLVLEKTKQRTYEEISEYLYGKRGKFITASCIIIFCFGVTVMYVIMIADVLEILSDQIDTWPHVFRGVDGRRLMILIYWVVFMMPLSLMREINSLRYASLIGMLSTAVLVLAMLVDATRFGSIARIPVWPHNYKALMALPTFTFSFCCQTNVFEIYSELKRPTVYRMTFTSAVSMYACTALYLVASLSGVAEFGTHAESNVLKSYTDVTSKWYVMLAMVGITFTLNMAFPICIFPMRDALLAAMGFEDVYEAPTKYRLPVAFGLAALSLIGGLFITSIGDLLNLLGRHGRL